ncbi:MAG: hypothetical protein CVU13_10805 [Bacteroidetes bacterium HGW-Bacteroidetes-8]|jgi:hypothetical protein|nr:MAG: hypothetical protein CVU13_10805 [Bacteroidetes bacterium HGW-Bacteroidetes-8]
MKRVVILFVLSIFSLSLLGQSSDEKAQLILTLVKRSNEVPSFFTKHYKVKAWSAKLSKPIPADNDLWTLSNFQAAMDVSTKKPIDWGVNGDRYVVVNVVPDKNNRPYRVVDDMAGTNHSLTFTLDLYEFNGKFVKTISNWGYLLGDGYLGVVYVQQGVYPTFLSGVAVEKGGSLSYKVYNGAVTQLSNLVYEADLKSAFREMKVDLPDQIPLQLSCTFPPKPVFDAPKTAILEKMKQESPFLQAKYYQKGVYDAGKMDFPKPNQKWSFWNMFIPSDITNRCPIDWGPNGDRYIQFDVEFEDKRNYSALEDDLYSTGKRFLFPLRLYESDGRFVKTISSFGNFFGFGEGSFVFMQDGKNEIASLFTKLPVEIDKPFSYKVDRRTVTKISELLTFKPIQ